MSAANKAKGTRFESEVAEYLQSQGIDAKRLPRTGVKDIGDVSFPLRTNAFQHVVVEAKARRVLDLPTFLAEASQEADNYEGKYPSVAAAYPVVVAKRRGKNVAHSYVVFDLEEFIHFLKQIGAV